MTQIHPHSRADPTLAPYFPVSNYPQTREDPSQRAWAAAEEEEPPIWAGQQPARARGSDINPHCPVGHTIEFNDPQAHPIGYAPYQPRAPVHVAMPTSTSTSTPTPKTGGTAPPGTDWTKVYPGRNEELLRQHQQNLLRQRAMWQQQQMQMQMQMQIQAHSQGKERSDHMQVVQGQQQQQQQPARMSNHQLQDYQMQLMQLEWQNRQSGNNVHQHQQQQSAPEVGGNVHEYQRQLMALEQQNKRRLMLARQESAPSVDQGQDQNQAQAPAEDVGYGQPIEWGAAPGKTFE